MSKSLDQPARKFFLRDLQTCINSAASPGDASKLKEWLFQLNGTPEPFSIVWIQGVIVKILESHDSFVIDDGTSVGMVSGYGKIQFASTKPVLGNYVMVVGPLMKTGGCPVVKAMKLQNLSDNKSLEAMWCLEVIDQLLLARGHVVS